MEAGHEDAMRQVSQLMERADPATYQVEVRVPGSPGTLPLTEDMLRAWPSGDLFALSQNVGMGWRPADVLRDPVLILSTQGGMPNAAGEPVALGYHTGHWEVGRLVQRAALTLKDLGVLPFAAAVTDPCDGRSQGTAAMFDSLPYRNDAALVLRRLIRSLPRRRAVIGVATCDKGLPAMMMALASLGTLPGILVPGGVTALAEAGEDAGKVQTIGARFVHGEISLAEAAVVGCRACASPGGGCQFLGTAATSQVVAEALGMALPHTALAPSGQQIWEQMAEQSARAVWRLVEDGRTMADIITDAAIDNAMVAHAAFGGSTNLLLHLPAIAHAAGRRVPTVDDWRAVNREVPRLVSVLPNGPIPHPTATVFLAGGVPEVMLHLRNLGLLNTRVQTVAGVTLDAVLDWWEGSERRRQVHARLVEREGISPEEVIFSPEGARQRGMGVTVTFPTGNLVPQGAVVKSTAIDPTVLDAAGIFRLRGPARVFTREPDAIQAIKDGRIKPGDVMVLVGVGPMGTGMEETYQITSALRYLPWGNQVALLTDARFSGVSTGACIGHVSPEGLAGGPLGKLRDGDGVEIVIDTRQGTGSVNFIGTVDQPLSVDEATRVLQGRPANANMRPDPDLPADTRLWAALQTVSGGPWAGAVYDADKIIAALGLGPDTTV